MKRIINGKAYNSATAQLIARAEEVYEKRDEEWKLVSELYRTKGGAFFLVENDHPTDEEDERVNMTLTPYSYDQAHRFARGEAGAAVELLVDGIFPTVPEAADERT